MQYLVTREFIAGISKGQQYTGLTSVQFEVGFTCRKTAGGSPYRILSVRRIHEDFLTSIDGRMYELVLDPSTGGSKLTPLFPEGGR